MLDLSDNKIQTISKVIGDFVNLEKLNISHNPIAYLSSDGFSKLQYLTE